MNHDELQGLRADIDRLDEEVIAILSRRFIATQKVGVIKAIKGLEAVDPVREAEQAKRYALLATAHGLSVEVVQKIFRVVIDDVVLNHQAIRDRAGNARP